MYNTIRDRAWRRQQLQKKKVVAQSRVRQWNNAEDVQWEDRRYVRQWAQMNRWYRVGKSAAYQWKRASYAHIEFPWYTWQSLLRLRLWDIPHALQARPKTIGRIAVTPKACPCTYCRRPRTRTDGLKPSDIRRAVHVRAAVAEIFADHDTEVDAAFHEAMLLDGYDSREDWYDDFIDWTSNSRLDPFDENAYIDPIDLFPVELCDDPYPTLSEDFWESIYDVETA